MKLYNILIKTDLLMKNDNMKKNCSLASRANYIITILLTGTEDITIQIKKYEVYVVV